jgi:hypothetical protein
MKQAKSRDRSHNSATHGSGFIIDDTVQSSRHRPVQGVAAKFDILNFYLAIGI